ncbi:MAG: glycosyltransferase [Cypionkella sp.]|nr:glycosyltransferase [Cypionkella sp.]
MDQLRRQQERNEDIISVVIPVHSRMETLCDAIDSALAQRDVDVEVIVVDDASPDPVAPFLADAYPNVRVIRLPRRKGAPTARNTGISAARGTHIAFLDSDDTFEPDKLRRQMNAMQKTGARWSTCGFRTADGQRWMTGQPQRGVLLRRNCLGGTSGLMADAQLLREVNFDPKMLATQDWELFLRLEASAPGYHLNEPLYFYGTDCKNRITLQARRRLLGHVQLYRRHIIGNPKASHLDHLAHRLMQAKLSADATNKRICAFCLRIAVRLVSR